jgi:hypothetical protein
MSRLDSVTVTNSNTGVVWRAEYATVFSRPTWIAVNGAETNQPPANFLNDSDTYVIQGMYLDRPGRRYNSGNRQYDPNRTEAPLIYAFE